MIFTYNGITEARASAEKFSGGGGNEKKRKIAKKSKKIALLSLYYIYTMYENPLPTPMNRRDETESGHSIVSRLGSILRHRTVLKEHILSRNLRQIIHKNVLFCIKICKTRQVLEFRSRHPNPYGGWENQTPAMLF